MPLHFGKMPKWLTERMGKMGSAIVESVAQNYGKSEVLTRFSNPNWFQAMGAVMGMQWNSSGVTASVLGSLRRKINPMANELGIYILGGKGKYSYYAPRQIQAVSSKHGLKGDEYYWLKGEGDPYAAEGLGETGRDLMKQVVLICVNAETRPKAIRAIRKEIVKNYPNFSRTNEFINPLIDETLDRHPLLADCFFSTMWKELQYKDSQIAEYVLGDMKARGQLALPVHDSFIVQDQYIAHLYFSMKEAYRMLGADSIPDVKIKPGVNSDLSQPSFMEYGTLKLAERNLLRKELEAVKKLEDLV